MGKKCFFTAIERKELVIAKLYHVLRFTLCQTFEFQFLIPFKGPGVSIYDYGDDVQIKYNRS